MPLTSTPSQYAQPEDLVRLALTPAAATRFGAEQQQAALLAASGIADSYIASTFDLPLQTWDYSLVIAVCNIAAKILYNQFGYNQNSPVDGLIQRRFQEALDWLQAVGRGKTSPQWVDASSSFDAAGDYVVSDTPVGFTSRGGPTSSDDEWW